jgi:GTP-sensing pleiotropic transcriptional regulator CodY
LLQGKVSYGEEAQSLKILGELEGTSGVVVASAMAAEQVLKVPS